MTIVVMMASWAAGWCCTARDGDDGIMGSWLVLHSKGWLTFNAACARCMLLHLAQPVSHICLSMEGGTSVGLTGAELQQGGGEGREGAGAGLVAGTGLGAKAGTRAGPKAGAHWGQDNGGWGCSWK